MAVRDFGPAGKQLTAVYLDAERISRGGRASKPRDPCNPRRPEHVHRSRTQLTRRLRSIRADHLVTLTKRGKLASLEDTWSAFERFSRLMDRQYGTRWKYAAVPELHADQQGWHLHLGVQGFFWAGLVRRMWFRALGARGNERGEDTPGNVDLQRIEGAKPWARVGRYLGKYLGKGFATLPANKRAFACSRGLDVDVTRLRLPGTLDGSHGLARLLRGELFGGDGYVTHWAYGGVDGFTIDTC